MKTFVLANDVVYFELSAREHLALSSALCELVSSLDPRDIQHLLLFSPEEAYEFLYSVYVRESQARLAGNAWLEPGECRDELATTGVVHPVVAISFDAAGSTWQVSTRQYQFLDQCVQAWQRRSELVGA